MKPTVWIYAALLIGCVIAAALWAGTGHPWLAAVFGFCAGVYLCKGTQAYGSMRLAQLVDGDARAKQALDALLARAGLTAQDEKETPE